MKYEQQFTDNQECEFSGALAAVLYGEADRDEQAEFIRHAARCRSCAEELVSFGALKQSLTDWRETEFSPLLTPQIKWRPAQEAREFLPSSAPQNNWLTRFTSLFNHNSWLTTGVPALAAVLLGVALLLVFQVSNSKSPANLADNQPQTATNSDHNTQIADNLPQDSTVAESPSVAPFKQTSPRVRPTPKQRAQFVAVKNSISIKPATASPIKNSPLMAKSRATQSNRINNSPANVEIARIPDENEEETAPRLTDLFDEVAPGS